jgi:hypothetical protein
MSTSTEPAPPDPRQNQILAAHPRAECERFLPALKLVPAPADWTLSQLGDHVNFLQFPASGVVSLTLTVPSIGFRPRQKSSPERLLPGNEFETCQFRCGS